MPELIPNLHPLLVHFPIALISVSAFFHIAAIITRGKTCSVHCTIVAHTTLWLGALAAIPTVLLGWQASNSVNHDEAGHIAMLAHRGWAFATLTVLLILAGWDAWCNKVHTPPVWWFAAAVIGAWGLVATTAWHGGELVFRHGLGVMALPESDSGHDHMHADDGPEHSHSEDVSTGEVAHEHSHDEHTH